MKQYNKIKRYTDFLQLEDNSFILWRLSQTAEQNQMWKTFIQAHPELESEFKKAIDVCDSMRINERVYPQTEALYQRILKSISRKRRRNYMIRSLSTAACLLLLITGSACLYLLSVERNVPLNGEIVGQIQPAQDIQLITGKSTTKIRGCAALQFTGGQISCLDSKNRVRGNIKADAQYNKLVVPYGKRTSIILSDGSRIWVNSGSEVTFPREFRGAEREINVHGEIFIDVAKSQAHPFIVHTSALDVTVLGTRFNLSAYDKEKVASVVLERGSVHVASHTGESVNIKPSEMAKLEVGVLNKHRVDVSYYTSWVDGIFIFKKTPVAEVLRKIGKYYNITFDATSVALSNELITGKLYLSNSIDDVLTSVSLITSTAYTRNRQTVKLTKTEN